MNFNSEVTPSSNLNTPQLSLCDQCGQEISDEFCPDCFRQRELEAEAEREAVFQREVIAPMLGFDRERWEDFNQTEDIKPIRRNHAENR